MAQLVWLITGCSSGFGEELVRQIVARGDLVVATARRLERIQHLEQDGVAVLQLDVVDSQGDLDEVMQKAIGIFGRIDVLINNAGYVSMGTWEDLEHEQWLRQFETNVFGVIKVTKALLPHFRQRRAGKLVFISSLSGWIGHPFVTPYAGSKFALEGIVEGLSQEVAGFGIKTLLIEPGRFRTHLLSPSNLKTNLSNIPDYQNNTVAAATGLGNEDRNQPGDVKKGVKVIIDLAREEGVAAGKMLPLRIPLGTDCYEAIKEKCEETLKTLEEWKDIINSTDHE